MESTPEQMLPDPECSYQCLNMASPVRFGEEASFLLPLEDLRDAASSGHIEATKRAEYRVIP
jgi:hypothetical protein